MLEEGKKYKNEMVFNKQGCNIGLYNDDEELNTFVVNYLTPFFLLGQTDKRYHNIFIHKDAIIANKKNNNIEDKFLVVDKVDVNIDCVCVKEDYCIVHDTISKRTDIYIVKISDIIKYEIVRIIRAVTRVYFEKNENFISIHSSAVDLGGKTVSIIGPKMSGKTSLAIALMKICNGSFVTNDVLTINLKTLECFGWPIAPSIRFGTIKTHKYLYEYIKKTNIYNNYPFNSSTLSDYEEVDTPNWSNKKFRFTPKDFVGVFDSKICHISKVQLIIVPHYSYKSSKVKFETIAALDIEKIVKANVELIKNTNSCYNIEKNVEELKNIKSFYVEINERTEENVVQKILEKVR